MYEKEDDPVETLINRLQADQHLEMMRLLMAQPQWGTAWENTYKKFVAKQGVSGGCLTSGPPSHREVCQGGYELACAACAWGCAESGGTHQPLVKLRTTKFCVVSSSMSCTRSLRVSLGKHPARPVHSVDRFKVQNVS